MAAFLPFRLGSISIVKDETAQPIIDTGFTPVRFVCLTCGAGHETSVRPPTRDQLVYLANLLSRQHCPARGHCAHEI